VDKCSIIDPSGKVTILAFFAEFPSLVSSGKLVIKSGISFASPEGGARKNLAHDIPVGTLTMFAGMGERFGIRHSAQSRSRVSRKIKRRSSSLPCITR